MPINNSGNNSGDDSRNENRPETSNRASSETRNEKKKYLKPEIKTEKVSIASLGKACNGTGSGGSGRKAAIPCAVLLS